MKRKLHLLIVMLVCFALGMPAEAFATQTQTSVQTSKKKKRRSKKRRSKKRRATRKKRPAVTTLYRSPDGSAWIHKGAKQIIISYDSISGLRAMAPGNSNANAGHEYADAINAYARQLSQDNVRLYMLIAPGQGEYYMPDIASTRGYEQRAITTTARYLDPAIIPVFVNDTLAAHLNEEIYSRTDHHWSPLGAYYAAKVLAQTAGVPFRDISEFTPDTIRNYVGTMANFSGDPAVKLHPENFVYYRPPEGYESIFTTYRTNGKGPVIENAPQSLPFFSRFADGSSAAYSTFMGGDYRAVKVLTNAGEKGRRLLIVKDSYGNAIAPCMFGSFEEVHVLDFRHFPHKVTDYVRQNGITDLVFVNCTQLAFAPSTAARLRAIMGSEYAAAPAPEPELELEQEEIIEEEDNVDEDNEEEVEEEE